MSATPPLTPVISCGAFFAPAAPAHPLDEMQPQPSSAARTAFSIPQHNAPLPVPPSSAPHDPPRSSIPTPDRPFPIPDPHLHLRSSPRSTDTDGASAAAAPAPDPLRPVGKRRRPAWCGGGSGRAALGLRLSESLVCIIPSFIPLPYSYHPCSPNKAFCNSLLNQRLSCQAAMSSCGHF